MSLADYLESRCPRGLGYHGTAQLCLWLHSVKDCCPPEYQQETFDRERLASAFAEFARRGLIRSPETHESVRYGANFHKSTDKSHWIEVIASIYKVGNVVDFKMESRVLEIMSPNGTRFPVDAN